METTYSTRQSGRMGRAVVIATAALGMLGLFGSLAGPAHAFTRGNTGSTGSVTVSKTAATGLGMGVWRLNSGPITVGRNAATTGAQKITIQWRVWSYRYGQWYLEVSPAQAVTTYSGQVAKFNGWYYDDMADSYATDLKVWWQNSAGTVLGTAYLDYVHAGDYQCATGGCAITTFGGQYGLWLGTN